MSDSLWSSSSASVGNQGCDMNSSGKLIHIYVDKQLRQSFSVCKTLPQDKQEVQITATLSQVLFDDTRDGDIILGSVRITTTPEAKPVATDELQKCATNKVLFTSSVSMLLAMNTESEITLWFMTPAGQSRAAQEALRAGAKRMKTSHDDQDALPLDQQFVHEFATKIAELFLRTDDIHLKMCAELCTCFLADILRPNAEYCDIARKAVRSYRNSSKKHLMEKNGNDTKHSATGSPARKDKHHHNEQCCWLVTTTLLDLAANVERLNQKDQLNTITSTARLVYFTLYVNRDEAIPDLPSHLKSKLLIDM